MLDPAGCSERDVSELEAELDRARDLVTGVVFSGGEPTQQPDPLLRLARFAKSRGLAVKLDTNGSAPEVVERMIREHLVDHVAVDVKSPLDTTKYARVAGIADASVAVANLRRTLELCRGKVTLEVRTTFVHGLLTEADVREIARGIKPCDFYALQQFRPEPTVLDPALRKVDPPSRELMLKLGRMAKAAGLRDVRIRTIEGGEEKIE
jgi:pyruvate formate lyase activating enzyme